MQQSPSEFYLKPKNRFPSCLSLELEAKETKPTLSEKQPWLGQILAPVAALSTSKASQIALYLSIRFGEESLELPGGTIRFGLKYGELKLALENGEVPLKEIELGAQFQVSFLSEFQNEDGSELQSGASIGSSISLNANGKKTAKTTEKVSYQTYQVNSSGSATEPVWIFEVKTNEPILKGLLKQAKLCTVQVNAKPCRIKASFEISKRSIRLTGAEGLWPSDIDRNKLAILERKLALLLLERKLTPCLSRVEVVYD